MKILMTGFDPFQGELINPAWEAVRRLPDQISGADVVKIQLPTSFRRATTALRQAIRAHDPAVIVSVGQAGGATGIRLERLAVNVDHAPIPDNDGYTPHDQRIHPDGPAAYFGSLPHEAMFEAISGVGVAVELSHTAGTFVCNHVFYDVCYLIERELTGKRSGFIHVPYLPEQVENKEGVAALELEDIMTALEAAVGAIATEAAGSE